MTRSLASISLLLAMLFPAAAFAQVANEKPKIERKLDFEKTGPQVGDELPELNLRNAKGEVQRLSDAWRGGPALLVTSSLTCPKSRSRWPELKKLIDKYEDQLNIVIVYVIEAHPVGSICPYRGVEDITPENERDGILRKQPQTLDDRLELAQEFKRYLRIATPIYIDNMEDQAWKALGGAPNLALLVDKGGKVVSRQGWFSGEATGAAIEEFLIAAEKAKDVRAQRPNRTAAETAIQKVAGELGVEEHRIRWIVSDSKGDTAELEAALKRSPSLANVVLPQMKGDTEATALMHAVDWRNAPAVELLLAHGADVKARTEGHDSALQLAAQRGSAPIVQLLLKHGADPSFPRSGKTPLREAAIGGYRLVAQALIDGGAPPDAYSDIALGNSDAVQQRLTSDPSWASRPDGLGRAPMDYAAANGQCEIASLLLAAGAPVVQDKRRATDPPLHRAIRRHEVEMVELLLKAGSSPDTSVGYGEEPKEGELSLGWSWTPALDVAISERNLAIVKLLIKNKVDLKARNEYSQTALHAAANRGAADIAAALIKAGADVNALQLGYSLPCGSGQERIPTNNTPLHLAAAHGNPETIKLLLAAGAKLEAENASGVTPLLATFVPSRYHWVNEDARVANIETLLVAGANINARTKAGATILDAAIDTLAKGEPERPEQVRAAIELLKKHGAKVGEPRTTPFDDVDEPSR